MYSLDLLLEIFGAEISLVSNLKQNKKHGTRKKGGSVSDNKILPIGMGFRHYIVDTSLQELSGSCDDRINIFSRIQCCRHVFNSASMATADKF